MDETKLTPPTTDTTAPADVHTDPTIDLAPAEPAHAEPLPVAHITADAPVAVQPGEVTPADMVAGDEPEPRPMTWRDAPIQFHPGSGQPVFFHFVDREETKVRPATVIDGRGDTLDLFVLFGPHDRLNGVNAEPKVMVGVKHVNDPLVDEDHHRQCWVPR